MEKTTVRRSVALPRILVDEAIAAAPAELRNNLNSLVKEALRQYVAHRKADDFERAMQEMAQDPDIRRESNAINDLFRVTEMDGL